MSIYYFNTNRNDNAKIEISVKSEDPSMDLWIATTDLAQDFTIPGDRVQYTVTDTQGNTVSTGCAYYDADGCFTVEA